MNLIENWQEEKCSAYLYRIVAKKERDENNKQLFLNLADMAEKQARIWEQELTKNNIPIPKYKPNAKTRVIARLVKITNPKFLRLILAATKVRGMSVYRSPDIKQQFPRVFGEHEEQHKHLRNTGNLRAAVFGINDGLVSNVSLILGVAAANVSPSVIILSGVAGLIAGACSMGAGEYISVRSQREMLEYQLEVEKHELDTYPEEEAEELALIYTARGLPRAEAEKIANLLIQNPSKALDTLAREELGINPDDLVSPWGAAISSFLSFSIGALVPLIPFLFSHSRNNLYFSIALSAFALFSVGAVLSLFTQKSAWKNGLRMLSIGVGAGVITYLIGHFLGVNGI